jgi:hypothetical protein
MHQCPDSSRIKQHHDARFKKGKAKRQTEEAGSEGARRAEEDAGVCV